VLFKDFANPIINGVDWPATARGDQFFIAEGFDQDRSLGFSLVRFEGLEGDLVVNFAAQYAKRF
jgi:hypothetical protein